MRAPLDSLTAREREVFALLRRGLTNEEIAQRLDISLDGAKYHVSQILSKLGVATRDEAAAWRPEERRAWWARWPMWARLGPAAAAVAAALGVVGVIAMGWGGRGDVEDSLPGAAQAESGGVLSIRTPSGLTSTPTVSKSATPTPSDFTVRPTPLVTPDLAIVENGQFATPEESQAVTSTPIPTPACPGQDYLGQLPWECVGPANCSRQVTVSVSLDKSIYKVGEPILVTLHAVNDSPDSILLCYADGQQFEIFVQSGENTVTFYSREEMVPYTQAVWNEQVPAGWKQSRTWSWDQSVGAPYEQGSPLAPGIYEIRSVWTANGCNSSTPNCPNASGPVRFVVEP